MSDPFDYSILKTNGHRPYLKSSRSWLMTQSWHELLFMHWPIDPAILADKIPKPLELDTFAGQAWIGVVPFRMSNIRLRGLPKISGLSTFLELNVRTYVRHQGKSGVYFFSLDANNRVAVQGARTLFKLPYMNARMSEEICGNNIRYQSFRTHKNEAPASLELDYEPEGEVFHSQAGTLDHWLTERYCLYTVSKNRCYRGDIHHRPWPLQQARAEVRQNSMTEGLGISLPEVAPVLHYAHRLDVLIWNLERMPY